MIKVFKGMKLQSKRTKFELKTSHNLFFSLKKSIMKNLLFMLLLSPVILIGQVIKKEKSSIRNSINNADIYRINKDWTTIAKFKSGIGETIEFFPIEFIDLKTGIKTKALQLNLNIKSPNLFKTVYVGIDEVNEFVLFIEKYVIPNLDLKFKDKSSKFSFKAKEMTLYYSIDEKRRRLTIKLNDYDNSKFINHTFWTETQVKKIPELLKVLKTIK